MWGIGNRTDRGYVDSLDPPSPIASFGNGSFSELGSGLTRSVSNASLQSRLSQDGFAVPTRPRSAASGFSEAGHRERDWWVNLPNHKGSINKTQPPVCYQEANKEFAKFRTYAELKPQEVNLYYDLGDLKRLRNALVAVAAHTVAVALEAPFRRAKHLQPAEQGLKRTPAEMLWYEERQRIGDDFLEVCGYSDKKWLITKVTKEKLMANHQRAVEPPNKLTAASIEQLVNRTRTPRLEQGSIGEGGKHNIFSKDFFLPEEWRPNYETARDSGAGKLTESLLHNAREEIGASLLELYLYASMHAGQFGYRDCLEIYQLTDFVRLLNMPPPSTFEPRVIERKRRNSEPGPVPQLSGAEERERLSANEDKKKQAAAATEKRWGAYIAQAHTFAFQLWVKCDSQAMDVAHACSPYLRRTAALTDYVQDMTESDFSGFRAKLPR